jgi:hypothetical protein
MGHWLGGGGGGLLDPPLISNITPADEIEPGEPGAFSVDYSTARYTPIEFDVTNVAPGAGLTIWVKFEKAVEA